MSFGDSGAEVLWLASQHLVDFRRSQNPMSGLSAANPAIPHATKSLPAPTVRDCLDLTHCFEVVVKRAPIAYLI